MITACDTLAAQASLADWPNLRPLGEPVALPLFPLDALPGVFGAFAESVAEAFQVPPDVPGMCALGVASIAAAKRFRVRIGPGHFEPVNLYLCALLPPGERKSATLNELLRPLWDYQREAQEAAAPEIKRAKERHEADAARIAKLRQKYANADTAEKGAEIMREIESIAAAMIEPQEPPTLCTGADATPEALAMLAAANGGRIAQTDAEAGAMLRMFGAYQSNGAPPNVEFLLKGHSGDFFSAARAGRAGVSIRNPALTLLLTGQPDSIRSMKDKRAMRARGLLARFLFALPGSMVGMREIVEREPDETRANRYAAAVRRMLEIKNPATPENPEECYTFKLSPEARRIWETFAERVERAQAPEGELYSLKDFASKIAGAVGRIAGLLTIMDGAYGDEDITPEVMAGAVRLGEYFLRHWEATIELSGAESETETARRILAWIGRHSPETFSAADLWRDLRRGLDAREELEPPLVELVDRGYIRPVVSNAGGRGVGRTHSAVYEVRPGIV